MHTTTKAPSSVPYHTPRRINEILRAYWDGLRQGRRFPRESDIDPDAINDIWNSCFLVKVAPGEVAERGYRYAYLGIALIEAFGDDLTNQEISARLINPASPPLIRRFEEVVRTAEPVMDATEFVNRHGVTIKYRSCMLPLGEQGSDVNYIIGGMKWKAF